MSGTLFAILQKYDFSSKSQHTLNAIHLYKSCLRYCKSTIFQANHNCSLPFFTASRVVCDTSKVRFCKQITTRQPRELPTLGLFAILQKYDFSSKSQLSWKKNVFYLVVCDTAKVRFFKQITTATIIFVTFSGCLRYCKSTIFQANHNQALTNLCRPCVVCDTAKVRFFKQITTKLNNKG